MDVNNCIKSHVPKRLSILHERIVIVVNREGGNFPNHQTDLASANKQQKDRNQQFAYHFHRDFQHRRSRDSDNPLHANLV